MAEEFETDSSVCGYNVYQGNWTPIIGEQLNCGREDENPRDRYAVAIKRSGNIVGHVPHNISTLCSLLLRRGGAIHCVVTGCRRYSRDLPQGGMKIPCKYHFVGNSTEIKKVQSYITKPVHYLPSKRDEDKIEQSPSSEKLSGHPLAPGSDVLVGITGAKNPLDMTSKIADNTESSTNNSAGLISTHSNKTSSNDVTSFDHSAGRENGPLVSIQCSGDVLSEVSNPTSDTHITMADNTNGKGLTVISSTDSTSTSTEEFSSRSNFVSDQLSRKNDKKVFLSGKAAVEKILSDDDTFPQQYGGNHTLWITFDRYILQMTDKAVLDHGEELSDRHIQMA